MVSQLPQVPDSSGDTGFYSSLMVTATNETRQLVNLSQVSVNWPARGSHPIRRGDGLAWDWARGIKKEVTQSFVAFGCCLCYGSSINRAQPWHSSIA